MDMRLAWADRRIRRALGENYGATKIGGYWYVSRIEDGYVPIVASRRHRFLRAAINDIRALNTAAR